MDTWAISHGRSLAVVRNERAVQVVQAVSGKGYNAPMAYNAYIFDLDGTLLNTLPDLVRLTNMVLEENGWPQRTREQILSYVGNGGRVLLRRAAPEGTPDDQLDAAFARWRALYPTYGHALTKPYGGMPETLAQLKASGARLGVLSNKFDAAVKQVIGEHFPGVFDLARGECEQIPRKPDPTGLRYMLEQLGVTAAETLYIGDSATDVQTALAAGVPLAAVSWGYQPREALVAAGAETIVDHPADLLAL